MNLKTKFILCYSLDFGDQKEFLNFKLKKMITYKKYFINELE